MNSEDGHTAAAGSSEQGPLSPVGPGATVTLFFELSLTNGKVVDSNFDRSPPSFRWGDGSLLPAFEQQLLGMKAGEEKRVRLPAEQAFGKFNPANLQRFTPQQFNRFLDDEYRSLEPGSVVSFTDAAGNELPGVIREIESSHVLVDFNHPLADHDLEFRVKIVRVIPGNTQVTEVRL